MCLGWKGKDQKVVILSHHDWFAWDYCLKDSPGSFKPGELEIKEGGSGQREGSIWVGIFIGISIDTHVAIQLSYPMHGHWHSYNPPSLFRLAQFCLHPCVPVCDALYSFITYARSHIPHLSQDTTQFQYHKDPCISYNHSPQHTSTLSLNPGSHLSVLPLENVFIL